MEVKTLRKITAKDVMELKRGTKLPVPEKQTPLFVVYGVANGLLPKATQFDDEGFAIMGRFEAVRASDRQEFSSQVLYLPGDAHNRIVALMKPNQDTGLIPEYQLGFNIGYGPGESPTGYIYTCDPILDARAQDLLADTRKTVSGMMAKLLPAPAAAPPSAGTPGRGRS